MIWFVPDSVDREWLGCRLLEVEVWASIMDDSFGACGSMFTWRAMWGAYGFADGNGRVFVSCVSDGGDRVCFYVLGLLSRVVDVLKDWQGPVPEMTYSVLCGAVARYYNGICLPFATGEYLGLWLGSAVLWSWRQDVNRSGMHVCCVEPQEEWVLDVLTHVVDDFTWTHDGKEVLYESRWMCPAVVEFLCHSLHGYYSSFVGSMVYSFLDGGFCDDYKVLDRLSAGVLRELVWGVWSGCMRSVLSCSILGSAFELSREAYEGCFGGLVSWKVEVCWDPALGFTASRELIDYVLSVSSMYAPVFWGNVCRGGEVIS